MSKRIETNIEPVEQNVFLFARKIAMDPNSTIYEALLSTMVEQLALKLNLLLAKLEYGEVSITDEPPQERQYSRKRD